MRAIASTMRLIRTIFVAALCAASLMVGGATANGGQGSHVVFSPAQPVAGQPVTFTWSGTGDYVTLSIGCDDGTGYNGTVQDDGIPTTFTATFPNATTCGDHNPSFAYADIYTYSGGSGNYQLKVAYFQFTVNP